MFFVPFFVCYIPPMVHNAHTAYCFPVSVSHAASDSTAERKGEVLSLMTCRASALYLLLSAVQLGSFSLQLLLLPQQIGLSCSSSRLKEESQEHFTQQTYWRYRKLILEIQMAQIQQDLTNTARQERRIFQTKLHFTHSTHCSTSMAGVTTVNC